VEIGKDDERKFLVCRTKEQVCAAPQKTGSCYSSREQDNVPRTLSSGSEPSPVTWYIHKILFSMGFTARNLGKASGELYPRRALG